MVIYKFEWMLENLKFFKQKRKCAINVNEMIQLTKDSNAGDCTDELKNNPNLSYTILFARAAQNLTMSRPYKYFVA